MGVSRVDFGGETLVDLTGDTVTTQSLLSGYIAHNRAGEQINGEVTVPTKLSELENDEGYAKENIEIESQDDLTPANWGEMPLVQSANTVNGLFSKLSLAVKNLRYLHKLIGRTDISSYSNGTITGAIAQLYSEMDRIVVKRSTVTVKITSIGQAGDTRVPYPEIPEGYMPFLQLPSSGTPNVMVSYTQFIPYSQSHAVGIPIRYIGYQTGNWPISVFFYYIKEGVLDVQV